MQFYTKICIYPAGADALFMRMKLNALACCGGYDHESNIERMVSTNKRFLKKT